MFLFGSCFAGTIFQTRANPGLPSAIDETTGTPVKTFITSVAAGETVPSTTAQGDFIFKVTAPP